MDETKDNVVADDVNTDPEGEQKTFTQDDVNRIIGERLGKERAKLEAELVEREREIAKKEFAHKAKELLKTRDFPFEVLEALNAPDEETLEKSVETIFSYFEKRAHPINLGPGWGSPGNFARRSTSLFKDKEADPVRAAMGLK